MNHRTLEIWTIYDHPTDYPDHFVVRKNIIGPGRVWADLKCRLFDTLEAARESLPPHLTRLHRDQHDEPQIVETWL